MCGIVLEWHACDCNTTPIPHQLMERVNWIKIYFTNRTIIHKQSKSPGDILAICQLSIQYKKCLKCEELQVCYRRGVGERKRKRYFSR